MVRAAASDLTLTLTLIGRQAWFEQQRQTKISASLIGGRHLRPREGRAEENINAFAQAFVPDIKEIQVPAERLRTAYDVAALPIALNAPGSHRL